MNWLVYKGEIA